MRRFCSSGHLGPIYGWVAWTKKLRNIRVLQINYWHLSHNSDFHWVFLVSVSRAFWSVWGWIFSFRVWNGRIGTGWFGLGWWRWWRWFRPVIIFIEPRALKWNSRRRKYLSNGSVTRTITNFYSACRERIFGKWLEKFKGMLACVASVIVRWHPESPSI